ncbi:DUF6933 domain-containing protein [Aporhodopirellula aestuarii]|uniref:DUF6933 domain-containing protein n=1 Tax=Aporhodopirellula aestuarii TaxID=2950107 RepID=UPI003899263E
MPLDENSYADWSCHLFTADRTQYIIMSNTKSLYSCVMYGAGITDDSRFIERALSTLREFMEDDGQSFACQRFIALASGTISFAKALNRSVTGSMTAAFDIKCMVCWLGRNGNRFKPIFIMTSAIASSISLSSFLTIFCSIRNLLS